jgi:hypothetical protein
MKHRLVLILMLTTSVFGVGTAARAQSERTSLSAAIENYYQAFTSGGNIQGQDRARWWNVELNSGSGLGLTAGLLQLSFGDILDENCIRLGKSGAEWRVGRFRSAFGQSDWSDNWYNGFPRMSMLRGTMTPSRFRLTRFDTGIDVGSMKGPVEYHLGLIDVNPNFWQLTPRNADHVVARVQTYHGPLILGFNGLASTERPGAKTALYDLDFRWSRPQLILRGEIMAGEAGGQSAHGYYVDAYFHPIWMHKTTLLGRVEGTLAGTFAPPPGNAVWAQAYTAGVKQVITPYLTLEMTHAWGNTGARTQGFTGWAFQAVTAMHL